MSHRYNLQCKVTFLLGLQPMKPQHIILSSYDLRFLSHGIIPKNETALRKLEVGLQKSEAASQNFETPLRNFETPVLRDEGPLVIAEMGPGLEKCKDFLKFIRHCRKMKL